MDTLLPRATATGMHSLTAYTKLCSGSCVRRHGAPTARKILLSTSPSFLSSGNMLSTAFLKSSTPALFLPTRCDWIQMIRASSKLYSPAAMNITPSPPVCLKGMSPLHVCPISLSRYCPLLVIKSRSPPDIVAALKLTISPPTTPTTSTSDLTARSKPF